MKIGDIVEARHGEHGIITEVELMYPTHYASPASRVKVMWFGMPPRWWRHDLLFCTFAINRVVSRASR